MALKINQDECTSCGDCEPECPTASITSKGGLFKINPKSCNECEDDGGDPRCVAICPVDNCIVPA